MIRGVFGGLFDLIDECNHRATAIFNDLSTQKIQRLNAIGAFIDLADARIAYDLLHAPLADVAVATKYLLTVDGCIKRFVRDKCFGNRRQ